MEILSHRGFWTKTQEKNSETAFINSFQASFGLETDLRDHHGKLVISHDPPQGEPMSFDYFAGLYKKYAPKACLALNIKADGLQPLIKNALEQHEIDNYFVFDMSAPDTLGYLNAGVKVFTRQSEIEQNPICYNQAYGIWIDCFYHEWVKIEDIHNHLNSSKHVCLVSPELHQRSHKNFWDFLKTNSLHRKSQLMLCTDFPQEAKDFFHG